MGWFKGEALLESRVIEIDAFDDKHLWFLDTDPVRIEFDGKGNNLLAGEQQYFWLCLSEIAAFHRHFENVPDRDFPSSSHFSHPWEVNL